jgi:hypothetical protein
MRFSHSLSAFAFIVAACGQPVSNTADAQPAASGQTTGVATTADQAAILRVMNLTADRNGKVENECGDRVTPQFLPAEMGGAVGTAVLFVMVGGDSMASCYGDGPGLWLMKREGAAWRSVYDSRGGYLAILPTQHNGVHDIAFAGPGFDHPLFSWNGTEFAPANRSVADAQMENATLLPP